MILPLDRTRRSQSTSPPLRCITGDGYATLAGMPAHILTSIAVAAYLAATIGLIRSTRQARTRPASLALAAASLGVALHGAMLLGLHRGAIDLHFFAALSLVGCGIAALTLLVNLSRPIDALGVIVFPLAALLLTIDVFIAPSTSPSQLGWQIQLHVTFALLAYSLLSIAALLAILLAFQERALRGRRLDSHLLHSLPPLTLTESLMFRIIGAGFIGLTLTLVSGLLFVEDLFAQHLVHKTALSIIAWLVFGLLLFGRWRWGWRGKRAVRLTMAGMIVLLLAFFGSKFVLELLLRRVG